MDLRLFIYFMSVSDIKTIEALNNFKRMNIKICKMLDNNIKSVV